MVLDKLFGGPRKTPEQVFTPRSADVNERMYIDRPEHEQRLRAAIRGSQHILIHGESGSGKSWLYKRVLNTDHVPFEVVNLANASSFGSIREAFRDTVERNEEARKVAYTETKEAELNAGVASGKVANEGQFQLGSKEPLEQCLRHLSQRARGGASVIVLENLESIHNNDGLMSQLGDVIILLDDQRYAQYGVKFIIVGVPAGVREYYRQTPNRQTVANRLHEIPEVAVLTDHQCHDLVSRGFRTELGYSIDDTVLDAIGTHAAFVTLGVPQRLHEYCLELARHIDADRGVAMDRLSTTLERADWDFLASGLSEAYEAVFGLMNERETGIGRRNQVLFSLGRIRTNRFTSNEMDTLVRNEFPNSTAGTSLNVSQIMATLASAEHPILRRTPKGDAFTFSDPRYQMCIRAMLVKDPGRERVRALNFGSL